MFTDRPFAELNLWQRIFAEHRERFVTAYQTERDHSIPTHWQSNVRKMLGCGDIRQGYSEYYCEYCQESRKVGFTCKSDCACAVARSRWMAGWRRRGGFCSRAWSIGRSC